MNQRGAVRAVSIVSGLAIFIGVLVLPSLTGLVGAADHGAECDLPEAISIKVPLRDGSKEEVPLPEPIFAGIYSVTLVSFDDHSGGVPRPEQTKEQWFVELLDVNDQVVYTSLLTSDLPDNDNFITTIFVGQIVTDTATKLRAVRRGDSIEARCAVFTPVPAGRIVVEKVTDPAGAQQRFAFIADYGAFELGDGEQHDSGPIPTGTHSVSEQPVEEWKTTANCSDGSMPDAIDLQDGEIVTCTFTNTESPIDLVVTLDDAPRGQLLKEPIVTPGAPFDYVVNVINLGPEGAQNVEAVLTLSDEVVVDIAALDPACVPAGTEKIVCSIGAVPVGEIIRVRVAVRVRGDSPGIGPLVSSVIVEDEGFPEERVEPNNRDGEPTTFPVANGIG